MQFWEIQKCSYISKWHLEMRRKKVIVLLWREWNVGSPRSLKRTWQRLLCTLSCALTVISFGTWQGRFSSEGRALTLPDKRWVGGWQAAGCLLLDMLLRSEVFKSFRKWCLNYYSFRAPVVYVLTMYVCFMKLFNLQFTFLEKAITIATDIRKFCAGFDMQSTWQTLLYIYKLCSLRKLRIPGFKKVEVNSLF